MANRKSKSKVRVAITIGDPSGIGPAITLKAIKKLDKLADFVVIGDKYVLGKAQTISPAHHLRRGGIPPESQIAQRDNDQIPKYKLKDLNNVSREKFKFGQVKAEYGKASIEYLDKALELLRAKEADCLVTCPICKESINLAGFHYSGHTEYLAQKTRASDFAMLLLNKNLRFSLITRHIPIKQVPSKISVREIRRNITLLSVSLKRLFLIDNPRIIVCGLNPHASDNGLIGLEENKIIKPALQELRGKLKIRLDGPVSADVAVYKAAKGEYDAVVAMYHDQALIPLKLSGENSGINLTLGLAFVRTSPLHGTAFDIANQPALANPGSLIEAIRLAVKCASNLKRD